MYKLKNNFKKTLYFLFYFLNFYKVTVHILFTKMRDTVANIPRITCIQGYRFKDYVLHGISVCKEFQIFEKGQFSEINVCFFEEIR